MQSETHETVDESPKKILALRESIISWLASYLSDSGKDGYVLGMSGGVDSTVLALMAKDAAERVGKHMLGLILPIGDDYYDKKQALEVCRRYSITNKVVELNAPYSALKGVLDPTDNSLAYTNIKARLRETVIYYHANTKNLLVLGTVNKPEFTIGYFPKNASAGDLLPQADLLKREIRAIGRSYKLPESIVNAKASGCVWAKTAEQEWGITEDELDDLVDALDYGEHFVMGKEGIVDKKKKRFMNLYKESRHKRSYYPLYIKKSS